MAHDDGVGARDMRFTFSNLPAVGWKLPLRDIVAIASRCEAVGFARFAVADLQFHYDVVAVMTACVAGTSRLAIESLVTNPYTRDATLLACAWAAMADLSGATLSACAEACRRAGAVEVYAACVARRERRRMTPAPAQ